MEKKKKNTPINGYLYLLKLIEKDDILLYNYILTKPVIEALNNISMVYDVHGVDTNLSFNQATYELYGKIKKGE